MREHPIPQDIVGYRFHIVGNMTIKQFAEIGVGVFIAFLLYQTNLLTIIKWPLMAISVAIGAALAFVPFEERPLDHWLFTFVRILYRPTKYYWKREARLPESFTYQPTKSNNNDAFEVDLTPARRQRIKEYMMSIRTVQADTFDAEREQSISTIMTAFHDVQIAPQTNTHLAKPRLKVRVRSLRSDDMIEENTQHVQESSLEIETTNSGQTLTDDYTQQTYLTPTKTAMDVTQVAQDIVVPEQQLISVETVIPEVVSATDQPVVDQAADMNSQMYIEATAPTNTVLAAQATFNQNLPFPSKPTDPNKLVGMVLTPQNDLVNDAIVEIKSMTGETLRAVKTNALGQFFVTTPLADGTYTLDTEKDGLAFSPVTITLTGTIVDPLEIRSIV
jgi:hypothetical protein